MEPTKTKPDRSPWATTTSQERALIRSLLAVLRGGHDDAIMYATHAIHLAEMIARLRKEER